MRLYKGLVYFSRLEMIFALHCNLLFYICRIFINKTKRTFHESFSTHTKKNHRGQKLTKMTACQMSTCKSEIAS